MPAEAADAKPTVERRRRKKRIKAFSVLRILALLTIYGMSAGAAFAYLAVVTINDTLPKDLTTAFDYRPNRKSLVISADGEEIGAFFIENRQVVPLDRMPPHVLAAFVSAEDGRFWEHPGFDLIGIGRAAYKNLLTGKTKEGASTITQQVIKMLIVGNERSYERKLKELVLAVRFERELSKPEILSIYLNHIYLGNNAYGVQAGAQTYFGKNVENLTLAEAALLAGVVPAPSDYAPHRNYHLTRREQLRVLRRMREDGYINDTERAAAEGEPIAILGDQPLNHLAAPYFVERIRQTAQQNLGFEKLFHGGLRFYATLDTRMQAAAEAALRRGLEQLDRRLGFHGPIGAVERERRDAFINGPAHPYHSGTVIGEAATSERVDAETTYAGMITELSRRGGIHVDVGPADAALIDKDADELRKWKDDQGTPLVVGDLIPVRLAADGKSAVLAQPPAIQGALVAIEPSTGRVRALVGGYDWQASQFDRASQAERQVGSAIKPFIYGAALAAGHTPVESLYDGPVYVPTSSGIWSPSNYDGKYTGRVTLRTALAKSLNTISVQLTVDVGLDRVIEVMRGFGISSKIPRHISVALGTPDLTLLELATAYAGIAAGGRRIDARFYDLVTDGAGTTMLDYRAQQPGPQVLPLDVTYVLIDMMKGVVTRGTARRATELGRPAAGKTGTSANFKDVWFIGFTPDLLCGVWIGRDNSQPIGDKITGGGAAVPIWLDFMKAAHPPTPPRDFPVPPGVTFARADEWSGNPTGPSPSSAWVPFVRGTMPARFGASGALPHFDDLVPTPPPPPP
ncbi:MAG TPA: PBP1A family penicillin-binding protein [Kofleriaceae bacterium]|nr:PBP1A family penicillin-binding protein [Kofleriaceae bacterium]